jgi:hypothetical protein
MEGTMPNGFEHEPLTPADEEQLRRHGIPLEEARRQLERLRRPPLHACLDRPCSVGDGIGTLPPDETRRLGALHDRAAREGRAVRFVPASGAATRMFKELTTILLRDPLPAREQLEEEARTGGKDARALLEFIRGIDRLPFRAHLERALASRGATLQEMLERESYGSILRHLLSAEGMRYAELPKGLLEFHTYPEGPRTPFEEHLVEAIALFGDARGRCRVHFTVSPEHLPRFRAHLARVKDRLQAGSGARPEVEFSVQRSATDALGIDTEGRPFRKDDGTLLLRPSGHGALLGNLNDLGADIVFIKNVDNVAPDHRKGPTYAWTRALVGHLVEIQEGIFDVLRRMEARPGDDRAVEEAIRLARDRLRLDLPAENPNASREEIAAVVARALNRPLRVCGMVRNLGDPGGGPFWVRDRRGRARRQIVESVQVDPGSESQRALLERSTHFNPVFMACGLRDHRGRAFDLHRFVDPDAGIITVKSVQGRDVKAMERPGLWNGSMAEWNTVFVEVPRDVFNPAKTVNDLLRAEHQPA